MNWATQYFRSSIGTKTLMAITGLILVLFVTGHMLGNLQIFLGAEAINAYGASLRAHPLFLWIVRGGLLITVVVHINAAIRLAAANRRARPIPYQRVTYSATTYGARTMLVSGLIIFAFLAYHLAHYTVLIVNPEYKTLTDALGRHDVYAMVVSGFSNFGVVALYLVAVFLLTTHLGHGIPSFFQSLGWRHAKYTPSIEKWGPRFGWILFLGFAAVPIGVISGFLKQ